MTSIFDFVKQSKQDSSKSDIPKSEAMASSIFEAAKDLPEDKEPSRFRSLASAPVKGLLRGVKEFTELPMAIMGRGPISPELGGDVIEKLLPTQNKPAERFLERGGKVASYLIGPGKAASKLVRGTLATIGGQIAEEFGAPESVQSAIEIGALLSPKILKGAQKHISSLYGEAEKLAGNSKLKAVNLRKNTEKFISDISRGGPAASKNAALAQAKAILPKIKKGEISVKELTEFKKTINEARGGLYTDQSLDKVGRKTAKKNLDNISRVVDDALTEYGKINPKWNEVYRDANQGHGAIVNSKRVSNWISRTIKQHPHASGAAIAGSLIGHALSPKTLAATAAGAAFIKTGELLSRISNSKVLRKYYQQMITDAVKENPAGFLNNLRKLQKALDSEHEEDYSQLSENE